MWNPFKKKEDAKLKPPVKPEWSSVDSFIIAAIVFISFIGFTVGGVQLGGAILAGYAVTTGAVFILFQFPTFKKIFLKLKRWFDAALLFGSFFAIVANFVFLVLTFAGLLFSGLMAILKYNEDKRQYFNDMEVYKKYLGTL